MESSHQNKILHWCRNVWVYHVLNFVNANSSQILKGPKPGTPHVINVHGFTLNKIYQKQKQTEEAPSTLKSLIEEQTRINEQAWKKATPCLLIY